MGTPPPRSRRSLLAGVAGTAATATTGCLGGLENIVGRQPASQLELTVLTHPLDFDPYAVRLANALVENLVEAGIDARVDPVDPEVLRRQVLINHDFDLYVATYPGITDPDEFRAMLHSSFGEEAGWQNPFGFSSLDVDELLEAQVDASENERRELAADLQRQIVREQPFTVIAFPDRIAGIRTDRFGGWDVGGLAAETSYYRLVGNGTEDALEVVFRDPRITRNRNPIAVEHRHDGVITGLLYEPLLATVDGVPTPWIAREIEWRDDDGLSAQVHLRDASWHDGERVTASDVAFTYEFLEDTSLGRMDTPVPTPWRRGRLSLVGDVEVESEDVLDVTFETRRRAVAERALAVQILPRHEWEERARPADVAGIEVGGRTTEALVWPNEEPVGCGPLQFVDATVDTSLVLERFDGHFLHGDDAEGVPPPYEDGIDFETVTFTRVPSDEAGVQQIAEGNADTNREGFGASVVPEIGRAESVDLSVGRNETFYHVGFNCRRAPLAAQQFRRVVARLVDRDYLVEAVFNGYASAAERPLDGTEWETGADDPATGGQSELAFLGEDGQLDTEAARQAFKDAGYQYDDGRLVSKARE